MAKKPRDLHTVDIFTGTTIAEVQGVLAVTTAPRPKIAEASVPSVPLSAPITAPSKPKEPVPLVAKADRQELPLFPNRYLLMLALSGLLIFLEIAEAAYDYRLTEAFIKGTFKYDGTIDPFLLSALRTCCAVSIALLTACFGIEGARKPTRAPILRHAIGGLFILMALTLVATTYYCERHYAQVGFREILRRVDNIRKMEW